MKLFILVFAFISLIQLPEAHSSQVALSFGPTVDGAIGEKKMLTAGYEFRWNEPSLILEAGGWNSSNGFAGFGGINMGVHIASNDGMCARIGFGPALISQTDDRLSSLFEFHIQARLGLEKENWAAGIQFDHFSNAGIVPPNPGRDVVSLYLGFPL